MTAQPHAWSLGIDLSVSLHMACGHHGQFADAVGLGDKMAGKKRYRVLLNGGPNPETVKFKFIVDSGIDDVSVSRREALEEELYDLEWHVNYHTEELVRYGALLALVKEKIFDMSLKKPSKRVNGRKNRK